MWQSLVSLLIFDWDIPDLTTGSIHRIQGSGVKVPEIMGGGGHDSPNLLLSQEGEVIVRIASLSVCCGM